MSRQYDVFYLVSALDNEDHKLFLAACGAHRRKVDTKYIKLYKYLRQAVSLDECNISALLKDFDTVSHLKRKIFDFALSLDRYLTTKGFLNKLLQEAEFLYVKGLHSQALDLLAKIKAKANQREEFSIILQALDLQSTICLDYASKDYLSNIEDLHLTRGSVEHFQAIISRANTEYESLFAKLRAGTTLPDLEAVELTFLELKTEQSKLDPSFYVSFSLLKLQAQIEQIRARESSSEKSQTYRAKELEIHHKLVKLWETYPIIREGEFKQYIISISNYLNACIRYQAYSDFEDTFTHYFGPVTFDTNSLFDSHEFQQGALAPSTRDQRATYFQNYTHLLLLYFLNRPNLNWKSINLPTPLIKTIESGCKHFAGSINPGRELAMYHNICMLYFVRDSSEDYKSALKWVHKIMDAKTEHRKDIQQCARVIRLFCILGSYGLNFDDDENDPVDPDSNGGSGQNKALPQKSGKKTRKTDTFSKKYDKPGLSKRMLRNTRNWLLRQQQDAAAEGETAKLNKFHADCLWLLGKFFILAPSDLPNKAFKPFIKRLQKYSPCLGYHELLNWACAKCGKDTPDVCKGTD